MVAWSQKNNFLQCDNMTSRFDRWVVCEAYLVKLGTGFFGLNMRQNNKLELVE